jgi:hypothetical protein
MDMLKEKLKDVSDEFEKLGNVYVAKKAGAVAYFKFD